MVRDFRSPPIAVREYGTKGPFVVLLHGGPGAAGYMAPVARELADSFRILEPFQRGSGGEPLTVARHVADLHQLIESRCGDALPAIAGHSWGAMLALAYAAEYPDSIAALVLIGCGTFDLPAREQLEATRSERMDAHMRRRLQRLPKEFPAPDERLAAMGRLYQKVDSYDLIDAADETVLCDARAHEETWADMLRLQQEGVYPTAFSYIRAPVLMLHGDSDPHPGQKIRASLQSHIPQLEYIEFARCGHYPWLERAAREEFYTALRKWLLQ